MMARRRVRTEDELKAELLVIFPKTALTVAKKGWIPLDQVAKNVMKFLIASADRKMTDAEERIREAAAGWVCDYEAWVG